jgi:hypothetical protein
MSTVRYELGFYIPEDGILRRRCSNDLYSAVSFLDIASLKLSVKKLEKEGER